MQASRGGWWAEDRTERYWLEATDRADLGANLHAPEADESGRENWRYSLFKQATPGDVVFHYHKPRDAIIAVSQIAGPWAPKPIVWGARGTFARAKGVRPHERPGYAVPLANFKELRFPLELSTLRENKELLRRIVAETEGRHPGRALYFPFELGSRPVRLLQGYAFKLPRDLVAAFEELIEVQELAPLPGESGDRAQKPQTSAGQSYAPLRIRLAVESHAMAVATAWLAGHGYSVEDVSRTNPFDLHARRGAERLTVEVKGTTGDGSTVFLTKNEVQHARANRETAVLMIVHSIVLNPDGESVAASGGVIRVWMPWEVNDDALEPLQYRYNVGMPPTDW